MAEREAAEQAAAQARAAAEQATQARGAAIEQAAGRRAEAHRAAEQLRAEAHAGLAHARETAAVAESTRAKLAAEAQALAEILAVKDGDAGRRMVDALAVPAGLEAALGRRAGRGTEPRRSIRRRRGIGANCRRSTRRRRRPPVPSPLAALVQGPPALARALSQIGLVEDDADAEVAQQSAWRRARSLVSRGGAIWRWDGYTIRAGTPTQAAVRLQQRNRLARCATDSPPPSRRPTPPGGAG